MERRSGLSDGLRSRAAPTLQLLGLLLLAHFAAEAGGSVDEQLPTDDDACLAEGSEACGLSFRQLRGKGGSKFVPDLDFEADTRETTQPDLLNILNPDKDLLRWDNNMTLDSGQMVYNGWLNVPLIHDSSWLVEQFEELPRVCLRIRAVLARTQPSREGPLLVHCGGPGSGRDCARGELAFFDLLDDGQVLSNFDLWSIDQRGVNIWGSDQDPDMEDGILHPEPPPCPFTYASGEPVKPFPTITCDEIVGENNTAVEKLHNLLISTDEDMEEIKPTITSLLLNGEIPVNDKTGNAYFNETFVRWYYRLVKLEHSLCFHRPRFQLQVDGGHSYNVLTFAGTYDLAKDIDLFRQAVGAQMMSIHGFSYGTSVAGVYATMFPKTTKRVVMDGVVNPDPNVAVRGTSFAQGLHAVWNGMAKDCDASITAPLPADEVCPAAPRVEAKAAELLSNSKSKMLAAVAQKLIERSLFRDEGDFTAVLMACIERLHSGNLVKGCPEKVIAALKQGAMSEAEEAKAEVRPAGPTKEERQETEKRLISEPDKPELGLPRRFPADRFGLGLQAAVLGTDTAGRLDEEAFITWWRHTKEAYPMGVAWAIGWVVAMATWPADPRPVPPLGSAIVAPVIVGNLHDPNTAYTSAQQAATLFPQGAIMTWQGYGHCLSANQGWRELVAKFKRQVGGFRREHALNLTEGKKLLNSMYRYNNNIGKYLCAKEVLKYIETGDLPNDGYACLMEAPLAVGTKTAEVQADDLVAELLEE